MHHLQAKQAFLADKENVRFYTVADPGGIPPLEGDGWLALDPIHGTETEYWQVESSSRLREVLGRSDLTRHNGRPLVAANKASRILAIAAGPAEAPRQLRMLIVYDMMREVLMPAREGQPEWWLFDAQESSASYRGERLGEEVKGLGGGEADSHL